MTNKLHSIDYYLEGHVKVAFCKKCSAEGEKLLEPCPQKISLPDDKNTLDEKKQNS